MMCEHIITISSIIAYNRRSLKIDARAKLMSKFYRSDLGLYYIYKT